MHKHSTNSELVLTADIGGSHITAALFDLKNHQLVAGSRKRIKVDSASTADDILITWLTIFQKVRESIGILPLKMGLAMPGPFDYQKGISYIKGLNKYESLYGINIKEYLSQKLSIDPQDIIFRNDAEATIAGEAFAGAVSKYNNAIGITLGTGFGAACYKNNVTVDLNWGSDAFKNAIADDFLSTRWFVNRYREITGKSVIGVKELALLVKKERSAKIVFEEFGENLIDFLAPRLKKFQPEALILCGNITKAHKYFIPSLKKHLQPVAIELGKLGEDAAMLGVAALFKKENNAN